MPILPKAVQEVKVLPPDTIKGEPVYIPGDTIKGEPVIVRDTIRKQVVIEEETPVVKPKTPKSSVPLEAVDTSMGHEKDYDLNESVELDKKGEVTADNNKKGKTLDLSNPVDFNNVYQAVNTKTH